jgi:hypothetical protein
MHIIVNTHPHTIGDDTSYLTALDLAKLAGFSLEKEHQKDVHFSAQFKYGETEGQTRNDDDKISVQNRDCFTVGACRRSVAPTGRKTP